jgi:hypothetical protein
MERRFAGVARASSPLADGHRGADETFPAHSPSGRNHCSSHPHFLLTLLALAATALMLKLEGEGLVDTKAYASA